jgi:hypothetical protein
VLLRRCLIGILLVIGFDSCSTGLCDNELIEDIVSLNGKYAASVFERNCGATTPYIRIVSLHLANEKLGYEDSENWVFISKGQPHIKLAWIGDEILKVYSSGTGEEPTQRNMWGEVSIIYE